MLIHFLFCFISILILKMSTHSIQNLLQVIERSRAVVEDVQLEIEDEDLLDRLNGNQHHYGLHGNQPVDLETLGDDTVVNYIICSIDRFMYYQIYLAKASRILSYKVHPLWE